MPTATTGEPGKSSTLPFCPNDHFGIARPTHEVMPLETKGRLAANAEDEGDMPKAAPATEYLKTGCLG
jgi:hypothetical protein